MPFMSGVEVVRAVREMGNPLYVVGCTGNALREDQVSLSSPLPLCVAPNPRSVFLVLTGDAYGRELTRLRTST